MQTLWFENKRDKEIKRVVKIRKTFYEKNNYCHRRVISRSSILSGTF